MTFAEASVLMVLRICRSLSRKAGYSSLLVASRVFRLITGLQQEYPFRPQISFRLVDRFTTPPLSIERVRLLTATPKVSAFTLARHHCSRLLLVVQVEALVVAEALVAVGKVQIVRPGAAVLAILT